MTEDVDERRGRQIERSIDTVAISESSVISKGSGIQIV
jgi:hypothetical protein